MTLPITSVGNDFNPLSRDVIIAEMRKDVSTIKETVLAMRADQEQTVRDVADLQLWRSKLRGQIAGATLVISTISSALVSYFKRS